MSAVQTTTASQREAGSVSDDNASSLPRVTTSPTFEEVPDELFGSHSPVHRSKSYEDTGVPSQDPHLEQRSTLGARGTYEYEPLQPGCTRVVVLAPGDFGTPLIATLEAVRIDSLTPRTTYDAISYAWGEALFPHLLHLHNGQKLALTESLHSALQHLRHTRKHPRLRFWADAVCINQSNDAERSAQVAVMSDIFAAAADVLVWLGPGDEMDVLAFAALRRATSLYSKDLTYLPLREYKSLLTYQRTRSDGLSNEAIDMIMRSANRALRNAPFCDCCKRIFAPSRTPAKDALLAVSRLLERPWFERLWVIQEVLGRVNFALLSGTHRGRWLQLAHVCSAAESLLAYNRLLPESEEKPLHKRLDAFREVEFAIPIVPSISTMSEAPYIIKGLVLHNCSRKCADPRDRVFALRRILGIESFSALAPDYSLATPELFRRITLVALSRVQEAQLHMSVLFGLIGTESSRETGLKPERSWPSWVPDFGALTERSRSKLRQYDLQTESPFVEGTARLSKLKSYELEPEPLFVHGTSFLHKPDETFPDHRYTYSKDQSDRSMQRHVADVMNGLISMGAALPFWGMGEQDTATFRACNESDRSSLKVEAHFFARVNEVLPDSQIPKMHLDDSSALETHSADVLLDYSSRIVKFIQQELGGNTPDEKLITSILCNTNYQPPLKRTSYIGAISLPLARSYVEKIANQILRPAVDHGRLLCSVQASSPQVSKPGELDFAYAPPTTRERDCITVIADAMHPVVLRPDENGSYELLGDAWVQGIDHYPANKIREETLARSQGLPHDPTNAGFETVTLR